ncbi:MAG: hypothetical protein ACXWC9_00930 [Pseudobdellovibrionaceae bacterium]
MVAFFQALMIFGGLIYPEHRILTAYIEKVAAKANESATTFESQSKRLLPIQLNGSHEDVQELILMRNSATLYASVFILLTSLIFGFYCSHRLGGPIFKTIRYLRDYRNGKELPKLSFRSGDFFQELAEEVNEALQIKNK